MKAAALVLLALLAGCAAPEPAHTLFPPRPGVTGSLERLPAIASRFVPPRHVDVWLPPGYFAPGAEARRYPVLYMHDGQNVFDPAFSSFGMEWGVDETLTRLIARKRVPEVIVVAVWNTTNRLAEYLPPVPAAPVPPPAEADIRAALQHPLGDAYLSYLVTELKPAVDARYRTRPDCAHTFIMGSSMGGLISLHAICAYPQVFGGAACLSTHWPALGDAFIGPLRERLPDPRTHKLYFDYGTRTLDAAYEPYQQRVDALLRQAGYRDGLNWLTRKYPGDEHSERAWSRRVHVPLEFLLGNSPP
jgi:predicted alpha/beta superfamily hydrolase